MAALAAVYLVWGSTYFAIRITLEGLPPLLAAGTRHLAAGVVLLLWMRARGVSLPTAAQWRNCAVVGLLLQGVGNGGVVFAQRSVSSSMASILVAIMPLWAALFAGIRGQWPGRREWVALALGACGVAWLSAGAELRGQPWATALLLVSSAAWGFGSVWGRGADLPVGAMASAAQMLCGGAVVTTLGVLRGESVTTMPGPGPLLAWVYLAVAGSLVAFSAYMHLLRNTSAPVATSYAYVNPVIATLIGVGLGGEPLGMHKVAGSTLVLSGVVLLLARPVAR